MIGFFHQHNVFKVLPFCRRYQSPLLFIAEYSTDWVHTILFICSQVMAIWVVWATMNTFIQISVWMFSFLLDMYLKEFLGQVLNLLRNCKTVFLKQLQHSAYLLAVYQSSSYSTLSSIFLMIAVLEGEKWDLTVVLLSISLMAKIPSVFSRPPENTLEQ